MIFGVWFIFLTQENHLFSYFRITSSEAEKLNIIKEGYIIFEDPTLIILRVNKLKMFFKKYLLKLINYKEVLGVILVCIITN